MEALVSTAKIAGMLTSALLSIGVPILLLILWRKRTHAPWVAALCGSAIFIVFVFVLESICHRFVLFGTGALPTFMNAHPWVYATYGALAAGVFEETGRFVAFKWLLKKHDGKETSVMYGIGHGGIESIILAGVTAIANLAFVFSLNAMGADAMLASAGAQAATVQASIDTLINTSAGMFFVSGIERMTAIALHISLSVLVFMAVKRKRFILYPVAILLHAGVDFFAVLYQQGIITSIALIEILIAAVTAVIALYAVRLYQKDVQPQEENPAPEEA
ncbi:MAG: YhfC family glutamic-type intramembrane protease [Eubacteriales bacterium]|nr:YhfC family glutamic-type intramembrane protease [Eubacteriales bacterium]